MVRVNDNYLKLPGSYLFSTIGKKVREYKAQHPEADIISLGIGDVTQPIAPAVISALHTAVDEMARAESFRGYAPDLGYDFLREAIAENDYRARGCEISADEIFVSDGAKCDCGNIQEIFSADCRIAVCAISADLNRHAGLWRACPSAEDAARVDGQVVIECVDACASAICRICADCVVRICHFAPFL